MIPTPLRWLSLAVIFGISSAQAATLANFNEGLLTNATSPISGLTASKLTCDSAFLLFTSDTDWNASGAGAPRIDNLI